MRGLSIALIAILMFSGIVMVLPNVFAETIPDWVKNTAGWWATDVISENEFVSAIEFLMNDGIIQVSISDVSEKSQTIPDWVKNTAGWWATDVISENEFVSAIEFLIKSGTINVDSNNDCQKSLQIFSIDDDKINTACKKYNSSEISELIPYDTQHTLNQKGFVGEDFSGNKPDDEYRIFVLGGSVMYGSGNSSPQTTIPNILQKMIEHNDNSKVKVINAANGAGNSLYQLKLIKTTLVEYEPDLVIIYSGWNDILADYSIPLIKHNLKTMCQIGNENNFDVVIFIQPIAGFGNKVLTQQEKINSLTGEDHNGFQLIQIKSMYEYLSKEMKSLENDCQIIDARNTFDNTSGPIYWDQGHLSDVGNFIMADRFLKGLNEIYSDIFSYDDKFIKIISNFNHPSIAELLFSELGVDIDYSNLTFRDETIISGQGNYFELKNEFGLEGILVGKDLRIADLSSMNLDGKDLTGVNLSGQDLRNIDFTNTIIRGANLSYTNLEGKKFSGMDLRGIDFSYANMKNVDFRDAIFSKSLQVGEAGMDCMGSDPLSNIVLSIACSEDVFQNGSIITNFSNADLTNSMFGNLKVVKLQGLFFIDFSNADLTNVDFTNVEFGACVFDNAILDQVKMKSMIVQHSDLSNTKITNFEIHDTWFQSVTFENTNMTDGIIDTSFFVFVDFTNTDLNRTDMTNDNLFQETNLGCKNNEICTK